MPNGWSTALLVHVIPLLSCLSLKPDLTPAQLHMTWSPAFMQSTPTTNDRFHVQFHWYFSIKPNTTEGMSEK